jgi:hypothetical protein
MSTLEVPMAESSVTYFWSKECPVDPKMKADIVKAIDAEYGGAATRVDVAIGQVPEGIMVSAAYLGSAQDAIDIVKHIREALHAANFPLFPLYKPL